MVHLNMVADDIINFGRIHDRPDTFQHLASQVRLDGIDQCNLFINNKICIVC